MISEPGMSRVRSIQRSAVLLAMVSGLFLSCAVVLGIDDRGVYEGDGADSATDGRVVDTGARDSSAADRSPSADAAIDGQRPIEDVVDAGEPLDAVVVEEDVVVPPPIGKVTVAIDRYWLVRVGKNASFPVTLVFGENPPQVSRLNVTGLPASVTVIEEGDAGDRRLRFISTGGPTTQGSYPITIEAKAGDVTVGEANGTLLVGGEPGSLDLSFGSTGVTYQRVRGIADEAVGVVIQADGKIVVAVASDKDEVGTPNKAKFILLRYDVNGKPDPTFGDAGTVMTELGHAYERGGALTQQPDGKLVLAGAREFAFAALRYLPDGRLDPEFGDGGATWFRPSNVEGTIAYSVSVQAGTNVPLTEGSILIGGRAVVPGGPHGYDRMLIRFKANGALDLGFSSIGWMIFDCASETDEVTSAITLPDGGIVVSSYCITASSPGIVAQHLRLSNEGTATVVLNLPYPGAHVGMALVAQPDGMVVGVGESNGFIVYRMSGQLEPDSQFALDGGHANVCTVSALGNFARARAVTLDANNNIVATGWRDKQNPNRSVALARVTPDGTPDPTFGTNGAVSTAVNTSDEGAAVAIQADGRIVVAGFTDVGGNNRQVLLMRYWP